MPPTPGQKTPFFETWIHYIRNPAKPDDTKSATCPAKTRGSTCVVCERVSVLRRTGHESDRNLAADMGAKRQIYANVVDMGNVDKGVQALRFGPMIYEALLDYLLDPETGGDYTNPDKGYNVVIERTGKMKDTRYSVRLAKTATAIADREWLKHLCDLALLQKNLPAESLSAILEGRDPEAPPEAKAGKGRTAEDDAVDIDDA
jgi:hypothetical protein